MSCVVLLSFVIVLCVGWIVSCYCCGCVVAVVVVVVAVVIVVVGLR